MADLKLAEFPEGMECDSEDYDNSTTSLLRCGLREGCTDAEYNISNRLQELRKIALQMANELINEGYYVSNDDLKTIEVLRETTTEETVTL